MTTSDDEQDALAAEERESTPNASGPQGAAGGMGSSSEWVGNVGPGQVGADGLRDTSLIEPPADAPPEQSAGGEEPNPDEVEAKAGHPRLDPHHDDKPY
jgi:hypothetical protein